MGIITSLLQGCSQTPISLLDLSCDSGCENLFITISTSDGNAVTTAFNSKNKKWVQLDSVEGVRFSYLSSDASGNLIASNENEILSVNFEDNSYQTLYKHTAHVFYPTKTGDSLYFSESKTKASGTQNPNQDRVLWKLDMAKNELSQGLRPWTAYQIGRPFIVNNEWLYIDFILPSKKPQSDSVPSQSDLNGELKNHSAYKLNLNTAFSQEVNQELLLNSRLFGDQLRVEQISIDKNGQYIGFYSISSAPSHWIVKDTATDKSLLSIASNGNDRLFVSPDGTTYSHVMVQNGNLHILIGMLSNKKTILDLSLSTQELTQTIFKRK